MDRMSSVSARKYYGSVALKKSPVIAHIKARVNRFFYSKQQLVTLARLDLKSTLLKILVAIVYLILGSSNRNVTKCNASTVSRKRRRFLDCLCQYQ